MNIAPQQPHAPRASVATRRRHPRLKARGVASHLSTRDGSLAGLPVENISMGGVFVRSATALDPGTPVMLQLVRPGLRRAIQVSGRVVSAISPAEARLRGAVAGMGIGFDPVDGDASLRLATLLDALDAGAASQPPAAPRPAAPEAAPSAAVDTAALELAEARGTIEEQSSRIAALEAEIKELRREVLRRGRTVGDLANRLAAHEASQRSVMMLRQ